jgi:hypothetical protein
MICHLARGGLFKTEFRKPSHFQVSHLLNLDDGGHEHYAGGDRPADGSRWGHHDDGGNWEADQEERRRESEDAEEQEGEGDGEGEEAEQEQEEETKSELSFTYSPIVHGPKWFPTMVRTSLSLSSLCC